LCDLDAALGACFQHCGTYTDNKYEQAALHNVWMHANTVNQSNTCIVAHLLGHYMSELRCIMSHMSVASSRITSAHLVLQKVNQSYVSPNAKSIDVYDTNRHH